MLEIHLRVAGLIIFLLAAVYPLYPRRFGWREQLTHVSLLLRNIFVVHMGSIVMLLALQAVLLIFFPQVLSERSAAAVALSIGLLAFWGYRLVAQLLIFDRRNWQGSRLHTLVHVAFTVLWTYLTGLSAWVLWHQLGR